ncbi:MAG: hypothetical protein P0S96_04465 [Simkaniaceae bacterium]|nr:hypothetical protein [Candidatus Sacchlamyda saccharinae]
MKRVVSLICFLLVTSFGFSCEDGSEITQYPTPVTQAEVHIDSLIDQAETHLLKGGYQDAREYFSEALSRIDSDSSELRMIRILFGSILANACLGDPEAEVELDELVAILTSLQCTGASDPILANGKPILGPETIPIDDCLSLVDSTCSFAKDILALAPVRTSWKAGVLLGLEGASFKAKQCCRSGGIWKACVQPLFSKWLKLKEWDNECRKIGDWYYLPSVD